MYTFKVQPSLRSMQSQFLDATLGRAVTSPRGTSDAPSLATSPVLKEKNIAATSENGMSKNANAKPTKRVLRDSTRISQ